MATYNIQLPDGRTIAFELDRAPTSDDLNAVSAAAMGTNAEPESNVLLNMGKVAGKSMLEAPGKALQMIAAGVDAAGRGIGAISEAGGSAVGAVTGTQRSPIGESFRYGLNRQTPIADTMMEQGRQLSDFGGSFYSADLGLLPDPRRADDIMTGVAQIPASLAVTMAAPGLVAKTVLGALQNSLGQYDEARNTLLKRGASKEEAETEGVRQFVLNLPAGALESLPWMDIAKRFGGPKMANAVAQRFGSSALKRIPAAALTQGAIEGGEEVLQGVMGDLTAKATYDPTRQVGKDSGRKFTIGAIGGAGLAGGLQTGAEIANISLVSKADQIAAESRAKESFKKANETAMASTIGAMEAENAPGRGGAVEGDPVATGDVAAVSEIGGTPLGDAAGRDLADVVEPGTVKPNPVNLSNILGEQSGKSAEESALAAIAAGPGIPVNPASETVLGQGELHPNEIAMREEAARNTRDEEYAQELSVEVARMTGRSYQSVVGDRARFDDLNTWIADMENTVANGFQRPVKAPPSQEEITRNEGIKDENYAQELVVEIANRDGLDVGDVVKSRANHPNLAAWIEDLESRFLNQYSLADTPRPRTIESLVGAARNKQNVKRIADLQAEEEAKADYDLSVSRAAQKPLVKQSDPVMTRTPDQQSDDGLAWLAKVDKIQSDLNDIGVEINRPTAVKLANLAPEEYVRARQQLINSVPKADKPASGNVKLTSLSDLEPGFFPPGEDFPQGTPQKIAAEGLEGWADSVLAKNKGATNMAVDPYVGSAQLIKTGFIAGRKIAATIRDFNEWSQNMISELGESIKPHLSKIWDEINPSTISMMDKKSGIQTKSANIGRIVKMMGDKLYSANTSKTTGKELFQNAVDAVNLGGTDQNGPKISYGSVDDKFVINDNGPGMTPQKIIEKFLPAGESGKAVGSGGGLGLAKIAILGGNENWKVTTISQSDSGLIKTILEGNGLGYYDYIDNPPIINYADVYAGKKINISDGITMQTEYVSDSDANTGTTVEVKTKNPYDAEQFVDDAMLHQQNIEGRRIYSGEDYDRTSNSSLRDAGYRQSYSRKNDSGETGLFHSIDTPEATIDFIAVKDAKDRNSKYHNIPILNRGILQFKMDSSFEDSVSLPGGIAVNIKSKVKAEHEGYPFTTNREGVIDSVKKQIMEYLGESGEKKAKEQHKRYQDALVNAPRMVFDNDMVFLDASGNISADLVDEIRSDEHVASAMSDVAGIQNAILKKLASKYPGIGFGRAKFAGLMSGGGAYGVHFGKQSSDSPSTIFHDIFLTFRDAKDDAQKAIDSEGGFTEQQINDALPKLTYEFFKAKIAGISLHEALHQTISSEGQELARGLTFKAGDLLDPGINLAESFKKQKTQQEYYDIYEKLLEFERQLSTSTNEEAARSFFVSQGGYQGYATKYSPADSSRAGGSRTSDSGQSNQTDPIVSQKLADRMIDGLEKIKVFKPGRTYGIDPILGIPAMVYDGAITAAQLAIRAGSTAAEAVKVAIDYLKAKMPEATQDQFDELTAKISGVATTVFHGGPHDIKKMVDGREVVAFDRFNRGTGEGAASFGAGDVYAAQRKSIANWYRDNLSGKDIYENGVKMDITREQSNNIRDAIQQYGSVDNAVAEMSAYLAKSDNDPSVPTGRLLNVVRRLNAIEEFSGRKIRMGDGGNLYEAEAHLPDDQVLHWDKPLSRQPKKVREAFKKLGIIDDGLVGGSGAYEQLSYDLGKGSGVFGDIDSSDASAASKALEDAGIKGIKFADAPSRDTLVTEPELVEKGGGSWLNGLKNPENAEGKWHVFVSKNPRVGGEHHIFDTEAKAKAFADKQRTNNYVAFNANSLDVVKKNDELIPPEQRYRAQETTDSIVSWLESKKLSEPGMTFSAETAIFVKSWDLAIDTAIAARKAGVKLADAIAMAVAKLRAEYPGVNQDQVTKLEQAIKSGFNPESDDGSTPSKGKKEYRDDVWRPFFTDFSESAIAKMDGPIGGAMRWFGDTKIAYAFETAAKLMKNAGTVSDNIFNVLPEARGVFDKMHQTIGERSLGWFGPLKPIFADARTIFGKEGFDELSRALISRTFTGDSTAVNAIASSTPGGVQMLRKIESQNGWGGVREDMWNTEKNTRATDKSFVKQDNYYPLVVAKGKLSELLSKVNKGADKHALEIALSEARKEKVSETKDKNAELTPEEEGKVIGKYIYGTLYQGRGAPGFTKTRNIGDIEAEIADFIEPIDVAIETRVMQVSKDSAAREFFGKLDLSDDSAIPSSVDPASPFGVVIAKAIRDGSITTQGIDVIMDNVKDYFDNNRGASVAAWEMSQLAGDTAVFAHLNNFGAAFMNAADLFSVAAQEGPLAASQGTVAAIAKRLAKIPGLSGIEPENYTNLSDVKFEEGSMDTADYMRGSGSVKKFLRDSMTFINGSLDTFGKEVRLNAARINASRGARGASDSRLAVRDQHFARITEVMSSLQPEDWPAMRKTLESEGFLKGDLDDLGVLYLRTRLAEAQPMTRGEQPQGKLAMHPGFKPIFALKSFMLRQIGLIRNNTYEEAKRGNLAGAALWFAVYSLWVGAGNAAMRCLIAKAYGKECASEDRALDAILGVFALNKYTLGKVAAGDPYGAAIDMITPPLSVPKSMANDAGLIRDALYGVPSKKDRPIVRDLSDFLFQSETIKHLPMGKDFYESFGEGKTRELERQAAARRGAKPKSTTDVMLDIFSPTQLPR